MKKHHLVLLSLLSGLLMALSWPSRGFPFIALAGMVPWLFIYDYFFQNRTRFKAFSLFYYLFPGVMIWNILTTYWLYNSTEVGSILAFLINTSLMCFTFSLAQWAGRRLYSSTQGFLMLVSLWITYEYVDLFWDISWPWLHLGNVFSSAPWAVQWYEYTGTFGGTLYVLITNILIFKGLKSFLHQKKVTRSVALPFTVAVVLSMVVLIPSAIVYSRYEDRGSPQEVVILQPNLDPYEDQYTMPSAEVVSQLITLAEKEVTPQTRAVIAPESALQERIWEENLEHAPGVSRLRRYLMDHPHLSMVTGASTFSMVKDTSDLPLAARYHHQGFYYMAHNTAIFLDTTLRRQIYHKSKLVAGVEQMPFKRFLDFLPVEQLALDLGGTVGTLGKSKTRTVFYSADSLLRPAPVICYESVYGQFTGNYILNGANVVFIITNDGWWGNTAGHRQHLDFAALRAIETRKSIARSANTGISAFVNQRGDILQATQYWEEDVIRGTVNTNDHLTFYTQYGDYIARISVLTAILLLLISMVTGRVRKNHRKE